MRLENKFTTVITAVGVELFIFALVGLVFLFQFDRAKTELVDKTKAIAETIGDQAGSFFSSRSDGSTSNDFFVFLDERLGRKKLFNSFQIAPKFFSVVTRKDVESGNAPGYFINDFNSGNRYSVKRHDGVISVSVPFTIQDKSEPFGIVKIESDTKTIMKKVLADNFLLYSAMVVVFNNQAFIFYLLLRKKKEVVFEKGYLREHSIGAIKIMHRVLGDIIEDHKNDGEETAKKKEKDFGKKVISISELLDRRKK